MRRHQQHHRVRQWRRLWRRGCACGWPAYPCPDRAPYGLPGAVLPAPSSAVAQRPEWAAPTQPLPTVVPAGPEWAAPLLSWAAARGWRS